MASGRQGARARARGSQEWGGADGARPAGRPRRRLKRCRITRLMIDSSREFTPRRVMRRKGGVESVYTDHYSVNKNITTIRRNFRTQFKVQPRKIPLYNSFKNLVNRFLTSGELVPARTPGRTPLSEEVVTSVRDFMEPYLRRKETVSLSTISNSLGLSLTTVWRVVRQKLGWFPYKPRNTIPLTPAHKQGRVNFCNWLLSKPEAFCDIWSDEKWFVLRQPPNRQNERYWAPSDPEVEVPCKEQGGKKVMAWVGVVAGRVILHWFPSNVSVNGERYLQMLQQVLEPLLTRDDLWFQQDGAPPHMPARAWLQEVFQDRVISRLTTIPQGCGGGFRRECGHGGGGAVGEEHQEARPGLQGRRGRQLRGQPEKDSEGPGGLKYQNVQQLCTPKRLRKSFLVKYRSI